MFQQLAILWRLIRGHRLRYGAAIACLAAAIACNYLVPLIGTVTIDHAIAGQSAADVSPLLELLLRALGGAANLRARLWLAPVAMVLLTAAGGVFAYLKGWQAAVASDGFARQLKNRLYDHLNHLPARHHDRADTGDLVQRCTSDVETTRQFLAVQIMEIANALILACTALPLLLTLSPRLTAVSFALILPIILYGYFYFARVRHVFKSVDEAEGALTAVIQENLTGIRVVRAFARQEHERQKFAGPNARYRDHNLRLLRLMAWYWSVSDFVSVGQIGLVLLVGAHWIATGALTVGLLFAFLAYLGMMLWPVRQMGRILTDLGKTAVALGRIHEILGVPREPETTARPPAASPSAIQNLKSEIAAASRLVVRDLHFSHGGAAHALNGISFSVEPGQTLALLGPSGAGKSTLIHLLLRLYDYERGSIQLDGRELASLPRKTVRARIGVVMQEPFLFSKTLRDNIRLGRGDAPDIEIAEAARAACIDDTILGFEQGYDTLIGERGITLSGGQRQRVALARAILKNPPLLILDDALSAVDGETETMILNALKSRHGRATTLVIAHRLSTLVHADRVIVLDRGRIIQSGAHAELAQTDGLYRRLWQIQGSLETDLQQELTPA